MAFFKISFNAAQPDFPAVCALIVGAKGLSTALWSTHSATTDSTLKALLTVLEGPRREFDEAIPNKKFCSLDELVKIGSFMGKCNKAISSGSKAMEAFLTDLGVPIKDGKRFFPHEENKTRSLDKTGPVKGRLGEVLLLEPEEMPKEWSCISLAEAFAMKVGGAAPVAAAAPMAAGGGGALAAALAVPLPFSLKLPVEIFKAGTEHPRGLGTLVTLHKGSRRKECRVPVSCLLLELGAQFRADNASIVAKQIIRDKRPVVELFLPCPLCKENEKIHLPFGSFCNFVQKIDEAGEKVKLAKRPIPAMIPLAEELELDIVTRYSLVRSAAARRNPSLLAFRCPKPDCKCAEEPRFFEAHAGCIGCVLSFKSGEITYFHEMRCTTCTTEACGLCNKPRSEHVGEREMCPRVKKITAEERAEGRREGTLFCPACELPIQWMDGCPHLTCKCGFHFCGNCEKELPVQATGTRYTHACPNPGRANAYFHTAAQAAAIGIGVLGVPGFREVNPARAHRIFTTQTWTMPGTRAWDRRRVAPLRAEGAHDALVARARVLVEHMAAGGGGAAAAPMAAGGGGAAVPMAAGGGGAAAVPMAAGGGGAAAAIILGALFGAVADGDDNDAALAERMQAEEWGV